MKITVLGAVAVLAGVVLLFAILRRRPHEEEGTP